MIFKLYKNFKQRLKTDCFSKKLFQNFFQEYQIFKQKLKADDTYLLENLPRSYAIYQYSFIGRAFRVVAMLIFIPGWYVNFIKHLLAKWNGGQEMLWFNDIITSQLYLTGFCVVVFISALFLFCHCLFHIIIRIIFVRQICRNSPWSIVKCVTLGFKVCMYSASAVSLVVGVPSIDYAFDYAGQVPPCRGLYANRSIAVFGENDVNCRISEGQLINRSNPVSSFIRDGQEHTLNTERIINAEYLRRKEQGLLPPSERELYEQNRTKNL